MHATDDTIAAIATAAGAAGVGIVRLSGPRAVELLAGLAGRPASTFVDRRLTRARLRDATGATLDDGLVVAMRGPASFTGEDVVELHGHGGTINLERLLGAALAAGARLAEPGEFTRRALSNGRLGLLEAEAMLGVVSARSERALRAARAGLDGELARRAAALEADVVAALAELEATLDFPEEGHGAAPTVALSALAAAGAALAADGQLGVTLHDGASVALRGPVNAGKSSLFNALLGRERALVAAEPGTTRDYLEERVVWDGVPLVLIDTAGERAAAAGLEQRGIALGAARAARADLEVWLVPAGSAASDSSGSGSSGSGSSGSGSSGFGSSEPGSAAPGPAADALIVWSKVDGAVASPPAPSEAVSSPAANAIASPPAGTDAVASPPAGTDAVASPPAPSEAVSSELTAFLAPATVERSTADAAEPTDGRLATSARTGAGLAALRRAILERVAGTAESAAQPLLSTARQRRELERATSALERAAAQVAPELQALELGEARSALVALRGGTVDDAVLDALFARFCIGK